jgi:hypothetical protein
MAVLVFVVSAVVLEGLMGKSRSTQTIGWSAPAMLLKGRGRFRISSGD